MPIERWKPFQATILRAVTIDALEKCAPPLPPCDEPESHVVEIRVSHCWYHTNIWFNKFTGSEEWLWVLYPCEASNKCIYQHQLCIDYSKPVPEIVYEFEGCDPIRTPNCTEEEPVVPPSGKSWEEPWRTECFAKPCCPN